MGKVRVVTSYWDQRREVGNWRPMVPVAGKLLTVVRVITKFVGEVYTKLGLKVKLQADSAGVMVTVECIFDPVTWEESSPIFPENTEVTPAG